MIRHLQHGGIFGAKSKAEFVLQATHDQFPVDMQLGKEPVPLQPNRTNAYAVAHTARLSSYQYPRAYGVGYKRFSVSGIGQVATNPDIHTLGVGDDTELQAGIMLHVPRIESGGFRSPDMATPTIVMMFRLRNQALLGVGKLLLSSGLDYLLDNGEVGVRLGVVSNNKPARELYEKAGFTLTQRRPSRSGHKLLVMSLMGRQNMSDANDILKAQL